MAKNAQVRQHLNLFHVNLLSSHLILIKCERLHTC